MTDAEALDIVVLRTGHTRFRELLDPGHPDYDPRFWEHVRNLAALPPWMADKPPEYAPPPPVLPEPAAAWRARIATCPYREPPGKGCGCQAARCWARRAGLNGLVGDADCYGCLTGLSANDDALSARRSTAPGRRSV